MKRNFFTCEKQESICQYFSNHANRQMDLEQARQLLHQDNQYIIGHEVKFCMQQGKGDRYFAFYYYYNGEVKDNYLEITQQGNMHLVDGTFSRVDTDLLLYFEKEKFNLINPAINPYVIKKS